MDLFSGSNAPTTAATPIPAFAPTLRLVDVPCCSSELSKLVAAAGAGDVVVAEDCVLRVGDEELVDEVPDRELDDEEPSATTNLRLYIPHVPPVAL